MAKHTITISYQGKKLTNTPTEYDGDSPAEFAKGIISERARHNENNQSDYEYKIETKSFTYVAVDSDGDACTGATEELARYEHEAAWGPVNDLQIVKFKDQS